MYLVFDQAGVGAGSSAEARKPVERADIPRCGVALNCASFTLTASGNRFRIISCKFSDGVFQFLKNLRPALANTLLNN